MDHECVVTAEEVDDNEHGGGTYEIHGVVWTVPHGSMGREPVVTAEGDGGGEGGEEGGWRGRGRRRGGRGEGGVEGGGREGDVEGRGRKGDVDEYDLHGAA